MKKILLTGSSSYLGTKFIEMYGNRYEILGVSRSDPNHSLDLNDTNALQAAFNEFSPDIVIHLAADLGRDATTSNQIIETNPRITQTLVDLAKSKNIPFVFTSTEAVYGGKEGGYIETDDYLPRSPYGTSKVESEKVVMNSGLPYLITRGHRYVGISHNFHSPKQFPDTLRALKDGQRIHLDSKKIFTPMLINSGCDILAHYIEHDSDKQILVNIGIDRATTYYDFVVDGAKTLGLDTTLIEADGDEAGWPQNSSLDVTKLKTLGYPTVSYEEVFKVIKIDYRTG